MTPGSLNHELQSAMPYSRGAIPSTNNSRPGHKQYACGKGASHRLQVPGLPLEALYDAGIISTSLEMEAWGMAAQMKTTAVPSPTASLTAWSHGAVIPLSVSLTRSL